MSCFIDMTIYFFNFEGNLETLKMQYDKNKLMNSSDYFKHQLSGSFCDTNTSEIKYDLTTMKYPMNTKYIKFFFDYAINNIPKKIEHDNIKITFSTTPIIPIPQEPDYKINNMLINDISLSHCF